MMDGQQNVKFHRNWQVRLQ